ncbi:hypothetical protein [Prochlorococcus marinus]|uniref:Uncharacterized protein n=1 Tax=Prochlorococcus marinus XMU1408 TaxID=2213228 RepID=A0A318R9Z6_PROMR|nr:hypothetical protein [Prochlorococcus marinus]MBW3041613.1 hypothetical protein [Prochlorococcus marinus str. XMU1408]PYE02769.1 hypothetical protein DNJ73_03170 [Prochlorococcus marinus XMU1408]
MIRLLITLIFTCFAIYPEALAQSRLLEGVKRNPDEAKSICQSFQELNKKNIAAGSPQSIKKISTQKNISEVDAEILSMYVRGLYCPETF